jgi:hypothetical protein
MIRGCLLVCLLFVAIALAVVSVAMLFIDQWIVSAFVGVLAAIFFLMFLIGLPGKLPAVPPPRRSSDD